MPLSMRQRAVGPSNPSIANAHHLRRSRIVTFTAKVDNIPTIETLQLKIDLLERENAELKGQVAQLRGATIDEVQSLPDEAAHAAKAAEQLKVPKSIQSISSIEENIAWPSPGEKFWDRAPTHQPLQLSGGSDDSAIKDARSLEVVHVTAEMAPIAKVTDHRMLQYQHPVHFAVS